MFTLNSVFDFLVNFEMVFHDNRLYHIMISYFIGTKTSPKRKLQLRCWYFFFIL